VKEVQRRGDVVAGLVPVVWQGEQGEVAQVERREDDREDHPGRKWRVGPRLDEAYPAQGFVLYLIDRSLREVVAVRLQVKCAEGLLVLGQVLSQHVPQSLGLCGLRKTASWLRMVIWSGASLEARPKTSWKSQTLTRIWTLLA